MNEETLLAQLTRLLASPQAGALAGLRDTDIGLRGVDRSAKDPHLHLADFREASRSGLLVAVLEAARLAVPLARALQTERAARLAAEARTCIPLDVEFIGWEVSQSTPPARDTHRYAGGHVVRQVLTPTQPSATVRTRRGEVTVTAWSTRNSLTYACIHEQRLRELERHMEQHIDALNVEVATTQQALDMLLATSPHAQPVHQESGARVNETAVVVGPADDGWGDGDAG